MVNAIASLDVVEGHVLTVKTYIGAILFMVNAKNVNVTLTALQPFNAIDKMELVFVNQGVVGLNVMNVLVDIPVNGHTAKHVENALTIGILFYKDYELIWKNLWKGL